eukprot:m51a1_g6863 hypothetical protein (454) ;mRNA; f:144180-145907
MSRIPEEHLAKWNEIETLPYARQAKWMLNGFWEKLEPEAENVWKWTQKFVELDQDKKAEGNNLDEFWSHKFLESLGQTMTVVQMRESFRSIDADFNKRMSIIEYLMFRYSIKPVDVVAAPQGDPVQIAKAQAKVEEAQAAVEDMNRKLDESTAAAAAATAALEEARASADEAAQRAAAAASAAERAAQDLREAQRTASESRDAQQRADTSASESARAAEEARNSAEEARKAAEAVFEAEQESKRALDELRAQEKTYEDRKAELTRTKEDQAIGVVKRNKAANELDQLLAEDPLPLRKAKINQAAAVKKCERASAAAADAKAKADQRAEAAEAAAAKARAEADEAARVATIAEEAAAAAAESKARADEAAQAAKEAADRAAADAAAAEAAKERAEEAKRAMEDAVKEAENKLQEALDYLEWAKKNGVPKGDVWWMEREIAEKKKYLPSARKQAK